MQSELASYYVGVSKTKFLRDVSSKWPEGVRDGGNILWYLEDLDSACDRMKPSTDPDNPYQAALGKK